MAKIGSMSLIHQAVHNNMFSGHMGKIRHSPNDPVFWLHHGNVDRNWALFQETFSRVRNYETKYGPTTLKPINLANEKFEHYRDISQMRDPDNPMGTKIQAKYEDSMPLFREYAMKLLGRKIKSFLNRKRRQEEEEAPSIVLHFILQNDFAASAKTYIDYRKNRGLSSRFVDSLHGALLLRDEALGASLEEDGRNSELLDDQIGFEDASKVDSELEDLFAREVGIKYSDFIDAIQEDDKEAAENLAEEMTEYSENIYGTEHCSQYNGNDLQKTLPGHYAENSCNERCLCFNGTLTECARERRYILQKIPLEFWSRRFPRL
jgi:hypothetical protein